MYAKRAKEIFEEEIRELEKLKNNIDATFDQVVEVMRQTGNDLPSLYKETSEGGLAKHMEQS